MGAWDLEHQFDELFAGRRDIYGAVEGRCVKEPLTISKWGRHLHGKDSVGVYPLVCPDGAEPGEPCVCKWGCIDVDEGYDMLGLARNLCRALRQLGLYPWLEKTKGKGYHVWIFAKDWIDAAVMRRTLLVACRIVDYKPKEVNPKQTEVGEGMGNYVNVPYAWKWVAEHGTRVVVSCENNIPFSAEEFVHFALLNRTNNPYQLENIARLCPPEPTPAKIEVAAYDGSLRELTHRMDPLTWTIFCDGPLPGSDRSSTLMKLAYRLAPWFKPEEALALMLDADARWGKFAGRGDQEQQLIKMLERAYG